MREANTSVFFPLGSGPSVRVEIAPSSNGRPEVLCRRAPGEEMVIPVVAAQTQLGNEVWFGETREMERRHCVRRPWDANVVLENSVVRRAL